VPYQFKPDESVKKGIRRMARRQIEQALEELRAQGADAVHSVRKRFKKVRAALRLARSGLDRQTYKSENRCFRAAGRSLSEVRDAEALLEAFDKLARRLGGSVDAGLLSKVREGLEAHRREVARRVLEQGQALEGARGLVESAPERIGKWDVAPNGWSTLRDGLQEVYRKGYRALAEAGDEPSDENLHEWRKRVKDLRHALEILRPIWGDVLEELAGQARSLGDCLGDDHDLAVLRALLQREPDTFGGASAARALFPGIEKRRGELQQAAFLLGRRVYGEKPRVFARRMGTYWKTWREEVRAVGAGSPG
jgi:CHAD domain-containing protein